MAKEVENHNANNNMHTDYTLIMKEEIVDNKIFVSEIDNIGSTKLLDSTGDDKIEYCEVYTFNNVKTELSAEKNSSQIYDDIKIDIEMNYIKAELSSDMYNSSINGKVKMEDGISAVHEIKVEFDDGMLYCGDCNAYFEDYCIKCGMLLHILNNNTSNNKDGRGLPNKILKIKDFSGKFGTYAVKIIPKGVKFGPFSGLSRSEGTWKLRGGKLVMSKEYTEFPSWMQCINPTRNTFEQNLCVFQNENKLYYHSTRQIQEGEELLVYFGGEYRNILDSNVEIDFIPSTVGEMRAVFACSFCCLGFSSNVYLGQHKSICPSEIKGKFLVKEFTQCQFCNIYLNEEEHLKYHAPYCRARNDDRDWSRTVLDDQKIKGAAHKTHRRQIYKCNRCNYKTAYSGDLKSHVNTHCAVKVYKCVICSRRFKTRESHKLHVERSHPKHDRTEERASSTSGFSHWKAGDSKGSADNFKCPMCQFLTKRKYFLEKHIVTKHVKEFKCLRKACGYRTHKKRHLESHTKSRHLKVFDYECKACDYKTNYTMNMKRHTKAKHLNGFDNKCDLCDFETNYKSQLERHMKSIHLEQFDHKCVTCTYKTNHKPDLERHTKTKHLKQFDLKCDACDYRTNFKPELEIHVKSVHLNVFDYKCEECDYKTNKKRNLLRHKKIKHLKEFDHECGLCHFKTGERWQLTKHMKAKHFKEHDYKCEVCAFGTSEKMRLIYHIRAKHLNKFDHKCELCKFETSDKASLKVHMKARHLKEFDYKCASCEYGTVKKQNLEIHIKTKHLKEFDYKCEFCDYETYGKRSLSNHVKSKHLKVFDYNCASCSYKTNKKHDFGRHVERKHSNSSQ